jgi:hypothetical protein
VGLEEEADAAGVEAGVTGEEDEEAREEGDGATGGPLPGAALGEMESATT